MLRGARHLRRPRCTDCANSGPRMISAPSSSACCAACLRALRRAAVVLHQQLDVGVLEFGERHLGGVLHRLRRDAGIACADSGRISRRGPARRRSRRRLRAAPADGGRRRLPNFRSRRGRFAVGAGRQRDRRRWRSNAARSDMPARQQSRLSAASPTCRSRDAARLAS